MKTTSRLKAKNQAQAITAIRQGLVPYDDSSPTEENDRFLMMLSVKQLDVEPAFCEIDPTTNLQGHDLSYNELED